MLDDFVTQNHASFTIHNTRQTKRENVLFTIFRRGVVVLLRLSEQKA